MTGKAVHTVRGLVFSLVLGAALLVPGSAAPGTWSPPPLVEPESYGTVFMDRISTMSGEKPVVFTHWSHRVKYTCRVCHLELGFEMKANTTEVTERKNREGEFCGACHDGKDVFGHATGHCAKCHSGGQAYGSEKFAEFNHFPPAKYGNRIDWTETVKRGLIAPKQSLYEEEFSPMPMNAVITLEAEWAQFPAAVFPHEIHNYWLDCANCHPGIFNIKKKTTKHFAMELLNEGKFCGVCHMKVAFPMNNCRRCHPGLGKKSPKED